MYLLLVGFILIACLCSGRSIGVKNSRMLQHNLQNKNVLPVNYCCENLLCKISFVLAFCYLQWIIWSDLFWDRKFEKTLEKCFFSRVNWSNLLTMFGIFCKVFSISKFIVIIKLWKQLGF
jgi:hypothetical protein